MSDPCENKGYIAKLNLSLEIDGFDFTSEVNYEFEVNTLSNLSEEKLSKIAKDRFESTHSFMFGDFDIECEVISINKN